jgi:hypothetical protein
LIQLQTYTLANNEQDRKVSKMPSLLQFISLWYT